ncbi:uncharacterized protein [Dysidea avara]|uniref:uncharacterized protein isoform X2 n=1 Tax=Dysidea avara TaxID=196820 RepID=UPI003321287F
MDQKTPPLVRGIRLNGKIIGQGAYAVVKEGYKSDDVMCAVKIVHPKLLDATKGKKYCKNMFEYEASILAILDHPNVVQYFGMYYEGDGMNNPPWLVMERLHTSLRSLINEQNPQPHIKVKILCDVAAGLEYLHSSSLGIVHCDLTPNNILLTKSLKAKIGDFGVSSFLNNGTLTTQTPGTALYMAPEARQTMSSYNEKLDIYSFGWVVIFTFTGVDPGETSYYRSEERKNQISQLQEPLQRLVAQCLDDEPQKRPNASEVLTQLHNIAKGGVQHTDNLLLSSASAVRSISNASLTGPIHHSHPALWAYSKNPLMSHCNSAPAGFASGDLPRQYEFLHNRNQFSRNSHDSSLTSSKLRLSVSPSATLMTGYGAGPELAKCSGGHTNLDVQKVVRKASSLTELFCGISMWHTIKEFSSITNLQCKSWSMAPVKFVYISADSSLCTDKDYEIEIRYKFDNVTASHFCCEMKTEIPNSIDLSKLKGSEFTIMLHKESNVRIGVLHIEAVSNQSTSRLITTSSSDELDETKLNDYMALLLWISLLQLHWLLHCVCLPRKRPMVCPSGKKEEYSQVVEDTCSHVATDTSNGIIMPTNSNCVHSINPCCTNLPFINKLCTSELTLWMHLHNIKVAMFLCINNLLGQGACNYINEMQVTELEKRNLYYHAYVCVNKADNCNDDRMLSSGTTAASCVKVQTLTVVESDSSPDGRLMPICYGQCFCYFIEQYHFWMCTISYTAKISIARQDIYYLNQYGIKYVAHSATMISLHVRFSLAKSVKRFGLSVHARIAIFNARKMELSYIQTSALFTSYTFKPGDSLCTAESIFEPPIRGGLYLNTSRAKKHFSNPMVENIHQAQLTTIADVQRLPKVNMLVQQGTNQPNASDTYASSLFKSLPNNKYLAIQHPNSRLNNQVTSSARWPAGAPKVLLYCNNIRNLVFEFHIGVGDVRVALQLNSTFLFSQLAKSNQLLNHGSLMLHHTLYDNMIVDVVQQCLSMYYITTLNSNVCQEEHVAMTMPPVFQFIMKQLLERFKVPSCEAKPSVEILKAGLICSSYAYISNNRFHNALTEGSHHSVPKVMKTQLTATCHYVKVLLGKQCAGHLISSAHLLGIPLHSAQVFHCRVDIDCPVHMFVTADLPSAGTMDKLCSCYDNKKKTAGAVGCLVADTICLAMLNGTCLYNQGLVKTAWLLREHLSYTLYSNTLSCVVQQFTPMCLTIHSPSNDDKSAVVAVSQASVSEFGYDVTTKACSAVEGILLAVTVNDHLRNQIESKVLNQVSIAILHTTTPSGSYCGYTTNLSIAYSPVVCGNQYMCHDKVLVHLFGLQYTEMPFTKITSVSHNHGRAINRVLSQPYQNKYLNQPNKVSLIDQLNSDTLLQSGSTRAECTQLEPLVSLPDAKLNSSSVCVGQHFYCCDPYYCSLVDQVVAIKSDTLDLTSQLVPYRAWTMYLYMWYWKTIQFPTSVNLITSADSPDRLTTIVSGNSLPCKEKVELFFDKLIPSCKNSPASRFMHSKLITSPSTTTASIPTCKTEFSFGKFNNSLFPNIQGSRWHCGKTNLLSFSSHPSVMKTLPNANKLYMFSEQFSILWIIAHMLAVNYPLRNYKSHNMSLVPVQNLEHRCNCEVMLSPDIAANVPLETFMQLDDRNSLMAKAYAADDVIQQATSINAAVLDQFVKSTQSYGKYLLPSCEAEVVQHFILLHLLASSVNLMISTLCHKTLDWLFEYSNSKNDTLHAGMLSVTTSLRLECQDVSPVNLTVAAQLFRDLKYPNSLVSDSQVINRIKCAVWFAEVSKPCTRTSSHIVCDLSNMNLSTYASLKQSTLILLTQFLSQGISPAILFSNLLDSGQMITLDATFCSRTVFYKIVYILVYHEFVKNSVQDIYKNTSKQYSFMLSVSFVPEFTSDLQVSVTMHMMLKDHSIAGNKVSMCLSSLVISNVTLCPHTNSRNIISKALTDHTIAAQLVGHHLTTLNYTRWSFIACDDEHNIQPHALIPVLDMVSQESLFDRSTTTTVLSHIDNLVHGNSKKVSRIPNVIVGRYVDIETYQYNQFVNIKHLVDKWSLISHHRLCNSPLIDVVQQLLLSFTTLLSDKVVVNTVGQIDDTNVTLKIPLARHKGTILPCNTECSEHHLNSSVEYLAYTTISVQLSVSSKNVNFLIVTAMNIITSSGVSFHPFTCVYSSNKHMSGDALAKMNTPHYSQSRKEPQQSTEIDDSTTMVFNLQGHNDTCELPVIFGSRDCKFKVGKNKHVMTQHFVVTHDLFDKQQMCFAIFLSSIVYLHFSYKMIFSIKTTLEFNLILHNRKLHPVIPSDHYIYNLVAAQFISLKYSMGVTECFLAVRWSKIILDGPLENPAEAELNYYGLKLVIDQQRSNCPCVNVSVNSFPSIWHKFVLNSQSFDRSSFHPMEYLRMHYYLQELPFEQTLACVTCSTEMVIATPPLNLLLGNNPADFRGHVSGNNYDPLSVAIMSSGFISLPPITSRECYANTQKLVHCNLLHHLVNRDKKTFDRSLCPKIFKTLLFNNDQYRQLKAKQPQQDNLHIQQDMERTREKQALLKVNTTGNGYGRQHNNNNGSKNSNSNHANGTGNGGTQGGGSRRGSQEEGNSGGGGRDQGTGSGNGDEGCNGGSGGSGNHGSGNLSSRSGNNEIPQGSENTPPVLQPEVNHTDRQPTIYRPLASPYAGGSNYHSSDFHVTSDNTTLWDFPHPVEETIANGRSVLVLGIASQKTPVSYHPHVEETNVNGRSVLVLGIASQETPVSYHPHVEETNVNRRSVIVIGIASQKTSVSYHPHYPLPVEGSTPDDSESTSKLAINLNLHYPPQHLPLKKSVLPSNQGFSQNNNNVIHISTIQTYMFQSENPVPHHDTTHPPLLQVMSENIDTTTLLTGLIHEVGEQYILVPEDSCPAEVSYLKYPKQFYAMLGTGGNTRTVFQESDIISKSLPGPTQEYQNYISDICGALNLCAVIKDKASCIIEMNSREVHCEQLCLVSLAPEGGEMVLLAPEGGGMY